MPSPSGGAPGPRPAVGRLAPSPTGHLHLGHARSFLLAWWHARSRGAQLLLRFEDLDVERADPSHVVDAQRDLEWLGIDWDGSPTLQSEGVERLMEHARELHRRGLAYPCVCTRGDIRTAQSAPHGLLGEIRYPGTCRGRFGSLESAQRESGRQPGLRFVVPPGERIVPDAFVGPFRCDPEREVGDFLITRRDGSPAYQLAVVVDDLLGGVTEVVRGDDLLHSAARQMLLLEAFGAAPPTYFHVPLVCDADGRRLAKREKDLSLRELREAGVDGRAVVEWAARCSGFPDVERPRATDLLDVFRMEAVPRAPVRLHPEDVERIRAAR
ncbi:MAG: tRNA glutamyl-Q(34) synthetase GluQRS [Myxococcales bacterium]|nr:tRNA glutamyl-Q(34) synthetase GluQRS [Myxococcales bacterium]